jgi:WD40 repeat protein
MGVAAAPHGRILALIREARRRARRRRLATVALILLGLAVGFGSIHGGGSGGSTSAAAAARPVPLRYSQPLLPTANGPLTMVFDDVRVVGFGGLGPTLYHCGPEHKCWEMESLAWSPDGIRFAFGVTSIGGAPKFDGLHVGNTRTGRVRIIRKWDRFAGEWLQLAWSSDGERLAAVYRSRIVVMNADGSGARVVQTGTRGNDSSPTWSREGRRLAFATTNGTDSSVYTIGIDGSRRHLVARHASWPAWSPDGTRIAVLACAGVKLFTPAGRDMTSDFVSACPHLGVPGAPVWSPDGRRIAMVTGTRTGFGVKSAYRDRGVWTMRADGSRLVRLTTLTPHSIPTEVAASWKRPAWRPRPQG